jgi:hypothetical protein
MKEEIRTITMVKENADEVIRFLNAAIKKLKEDIPDLNKGCCGYLALKIGGLLISNKIYSFSFATILPLWSHSGLKAFSHIWIILELCDGDTIKIVQLNKGETKKKRTEIEVIKQFYLMPALENSLMKENSWAWGKSLTNENRLKIDKALSSFMKEKTIHYAKDCKNAMELVGENIRACAKLSGKDRVEPFTIQNVDLMKNKWVENKESGKQDVIAEITELGVILMSNKKLISFVGLLERYVFLSKSPCGVVIKAKRIGCHSKVDCEHFVKNTK